MIPAVDDLRPHVGHAVLAVIRDLLSAEVSPARRRLSSTRGIEPASSRGAFPPEKN